MYVVNTLIKVQLSQSNAIKIIQMLQYKYYSRAEPFLEDNFE